MKTKKLFLLGVSLMVLSGCTGEAEENDESSEEGMGTLSSEPENDDSSENENTSTEESTEETTNDSGLLDLSNTEKGWINFEGELGGSSEYVTTQKIDYNPDVNYELTIGGYIAYFNGDEFIQTVQQGEGTIEQVDEADNIRVSYHNTFEDSISLKEE